MDYLDYPKMNFQIAFFNVLQWSPKKSKISKETMKNEICNEIPPKISAVNVWWILGNTPKLESFVN